MTSRKLMHMVGKRTVNVTAYPSTVWLSKPPPIKITAQCLSSNILHIIFFFFGPAQIPMLASLLTPGTHSRIQECSQVLM